ncbi:ATPase [Sphingomonas donggukensis]|uniref:ATPase n=1 Tax=Sphingomonas donggukensis TaxID=2949093 RepID=A0ABY4TQX6_9SPHN|nr:ATP12 family protein [Sphingomonas donggukensis]URW74790.1 ATPase [Sphingomonas donggukensis]
MKRFWSDVAVHASDGTHAVTLDGKPVRTPGRLPLAVPHALLADAIADEWRAVEGEIDPRAMPLTGLANAAIERIAPAPGPFADGLARYAESDLLYYRAVDPPELVARQEAAWNPLLDWARGRYDVHFETTSGVMPTPQPRETVERLAAAVIARDAYELAALSPIVTVTGSLILGLAVLEGAADPETVWQAARIDEDWQIELWGEDPLATAATAAHRADFDAGVRMLDLVS